MTVLNVKSPPAMKEMSFQSQAGAGIFNTLVLLLVKMYCICIFFALFIVILQAGLSH